MLPAAQPALDRAPRRGLHDSLRALLSSLLATRSSQSIARRLVDAPTAAQTAALPHRLGSFDLARSSIASAYLAMEPVRDACTSLLRAVRR